MKTGKRTLRIEPSAKKMLTRAARARGMSTSDYVRSLVVEQAQRDLDEARSGTIRLFAREQRDSWKARNVSVRLTPRQRRLASVMRGE